MKLGLLGFVLAVVFSSTLSANTLDKLKSTPATKYELGKVQLEITSFLLTQKIKGERVGDSKFRVQKFAVSENNGQLLLIGSLEGKTKEIKESVCQNILLQLTADESGAFSNISKRLWPELSEAEHESLKDIVKLSIKLISKDNADFSVQC